MAWGYWSATAVDRGRSPRRNTQCTVMPINTVPQSEPPAPTCYSPCRSSRCSSPSCQGRERHMSCAHFNPKSKFNNKKRVDPKTIQAIWLRALITGVKSLNSCSMTMNQCSHWIDHSDNFSQVIFHIIESLLFWSLPSQAQCQDSQCHCIEDSPPPHSVLSQQTCPIDSGNGNGGPGIMNDEYSRRPSIDRLDSPQVYMQIE